MPVTPTYPGVYIEELPGGVRPITGGAPTITAFIGYVARGLDSRAKRISSFADFERSFGGLASDSEVSYAVQHFFSNGGADAIVVRVPKADAVSALITLEDGDGVGAKNALAFTPLSKGAWAHNVLIDADSAGIPATDAKAFNFTITDLTTRAGAYFGKVTMDPAKSTYAEAISNDVDNGSQMVSVKVADATAGRPMATGSSGGDITLADVKNDNDYTLKVTSDVPA